MIATATKVRTLGPVSVSGVRGWPMPDAAYLRDRGFSGSQTLIVVDWSAVLGGEP